MFDLQVATGTIKNKDVCAFITKMKAETENIHEYARENLKDSGASHKTAYDLRKRETEYHVGDLVLLRDKARRKGFSYKLQNAWKGPYVVKSCLSPDIYKILNAKKESVVHHDALKPYTGGSVPLKLKRIRHQITGEEEVKEEVKE